ncbi:MAG: S8 family peptidase, partial [Lachnospiraceae bacterium]|nr:S8 family peptidase [Lachnospiraceae bacterium]
LRNASYAQNIPAGETAVAGMRLSGTPGTEGELLENVTVRQIVPSGEGGPTPSDNQISDKNVSDNSVSDNNVSDNNISGNGMPEGYINHLSTGGEGGEIYYKTAYESDVVTAPNRLPCIRNQFLLSADDTVDFAEVEAYLAQNGAGIVGYIEATNDYQVEMYQDTDMTDLQELTERIGVQAWVRHIGLNYLWLEEACFQPSDPWTGSSDEDVILEESTFNISTPSGNNWGLELIDFEGALINAGVINSSQSLSADVYIDHLTTVRMGIIDSSFDVWHEDLDDNFVTAILNYETRADLWGNSLLSHGTHVAGIMCAEFNNGIGMNGICIKNELYGAALNGVKHSIYDAKNKCDTTFSVMCRLGFLIQHNVKVINYSSGVLDGMAYSASMDPENSLAIQYLNNEAFLMEKFLTKYLKEGYDFLIVTSAGNGNGSEYYEIKEGFQADYGCEYIVSSDIVDWAIGVVTVDENPQTPQVAIDAKYASIFNYIPPTSLCYDHILCVGALQLNEDGSVDVAFYNNIGNRVNIYAPGSNIYSTYVTGAKCIDSRHNDCGTGYGHMDGTSMAAPHVSGVAGLAYNVDPNISAADLKQIIINTAKDINGIHILNAADVIADVVQYKESDGTEEYTIQLHVTNANGNGVKNATVEVRSRSFYWCKVLGAAMRSDAVGDTLVYSGNTDTVGNIKLDIPQGSYYVLVDGEYCGVLEEISVSNEDITEQAVKEVTLPDYQDENRGVILQLSSSTAGENVNSYGFIIHGEIRFIKGWIDTDIDNIRLEDYIREGEVTADGGEEVAVYHTRADFGDISVQLPEGIYTVEVMLPNEEPQYYHIIISDKYDFTFYRFEM